MPGSIFVTVPEKMSVGMLRCGIPFSANPSKCYCIKMIDFIATTDQLATWQQLSSLALQTWLITTKTMMPLKRKKKKKTFTI